MNKRKDILSDRALQAIILRRNADLLRVMQSQVLGEAITNELLDLILDDLDSELVEFGLLEGDEPNAYGMFVEDLRSQVSSMFN